VSRWGPLDARARRLVKVGIAAGAGSEGALRSAIRNALAEGVSKDEIGHAILLSVTTIGFANAQAALSWAEHILSKKWGFVAHSYLEHETRVPFMPGTAPAATGCSSSVRPETFEPMLSSPVKSESGCASLSKFCAEDMAPLQSTLLVQSRNP
jgi:carboxymuconolactone decarboxylase family protein